MKSLKQTLLELSICIITDAMDELSTAPHERDIRTISRRVEQEGLSFLTITLPKFCEDIMLSLELGYIPSTCFRSFRKHGLIPAFLQGITGLLFDKQTGRIIDAVPSKQSCHTTDGTLALQAIRQICLGFKKIKIPCLPERERQAYLNYIEIERELESFQSPNDAIFKKVSALLWSRVFDRGDIFGHLTITPKHGPGAVAEGLTNNRKWTFPTWYERLERTFPVTSFAIVNENFLDQLSCINTAKQIKNNTGILEIVPQEHELPVKVITVPKTQTSPRIIGIEPSCLQYCQQGTSLFIRNKIETHPLTSGCINFTSQEVNQVLAKESSKTLIKATIDLSSASDRVPLVGIEEMLESVPDIRQGILDCRSMTAACSSKDVGINFRIPLKKYASMGSALTFPLESMYFYTICVTALIRNRKLPVSFETLQSLKGEVHVYGDDIIVPTNEVDHVVDLLQKYNCKVNTTKSFWKSNFRESCGVDAYNGVVITPTYIRQLPPRRRGDSARIISWIKTAQQFTVKRMFRTAEFMYATVEKNIHWYIPTVGPDCSGLGRLWTSEFRQKSGKWRYNLDLHRLEKFCLVPKDIEEEDILDGEPALLKCLVSSSTERDEDHLRVSTRPYSVKLESKWVDARL